MSTKKVLAGAMVIGVLGVAAPVALADPPGPGD
jgi:hypothetical protein